MQIKSFLWEVIRLLNEVKVAVLHSSGQAAGVFVNRRGSKI